jgi:hypothetical protein
MFKILPPFPNFCVLLKRRYQATKLHDIKIKAYAASALQISIFVRHMTVKMIALDDFHAVQSTNTTLRDVTHHTTVMVLNVVLR